ncbi:hypothetical protein [Natrinema salaciae]|uniref:Uncharacterized protein n=1 Tax=Natrinema salaciae TaxID=1186196 RepID=A0A1H9B9Z5_9EURY|nr:hypothetical protein [Natrinema salaciae]SEP85048.1 hypothetical protein SAMN04489841_0661 [Natrinema salaciae]
MCPTVSPADVDKTVENANGDVIGTITEIEGETVSVEPRSGVIDSIRAALGWERAHEDTVRIHESAVASISGDVIRLESESADPTAGAGTDDGEREDSSESTRERRLESDTGPSEPDAIVDRDPDRTGEASGIESSTSTAESDRTPAADPLREVDTTDETRPTEGTTDADDVDGTERMHPAADSDEPDTESGFGDPITADEVVDTDARDGVEGTAGTDETESTDRSNAAGADDESGTSSIDERSDTDASSDRGDGDGSTEPSRTEADGETETESLNGATGSGIPDEAASTVDLTDERGVTDGLPVSDDGESTSESPSAATDRSDASVRRADSESLEAVSDGMDDRAERNPTEDVGLTAELDIGRNIESAARSDDSDGAADAAETPSDEGTLADELDRGTGIESVAASGPSDGPDGNADTSPSAERDLASELDRGTDLEAVTDPDREPAAAIDPATIGGAEPRSGDDDELVDRRILTDDDSSIDRRPAEAVPGVDSDRRGDSDGEPTDGRKGGRRTASPISTAFAVQQQLFRSTLAGQVALQRQQLQLGRAVAYGTVSLATAMTRTKSDASDEIDDRDGPDQPR